MAVFEYRGRSAAGEAVTGQLQAPNADQAATLLMERQITPISIRAQEGKTTSAGKPGEISFKEIKFLQRVKLDELIIFTRQMYSLTKAGVPITRAMRGLAQSVRNPLLQETLNNVTDDLEQGFTLSGCLNKHPKVFSRLFISLIHVGENTGNLDQAFLQISHYLELERTTRKNIKSATRYPMFVILAIIGAMVVVNIWVIPAFAGVFASLGAQLPWQTRALISISEFTRDYWYMLLGSAVFVVVSVIRYIDTDVGRVNWDRIKLRLPVVGGMFERIIMGRFCRTFALVMRAGIPIEQGLAVVASAVGNAHIGSKVNGMRSGIERGEALTRTALNAAMFSPLVLQMLAVGEETGSMDEMLDEAASFYEQEVEYDLKGLASAIEPILIIIIGMMVLVLALGIFLPLWELSTKM